jgi:hypothetical protein
MADQTHILVLDACGHVTPAGARARALRAAGNARRWERRLCTVMLKRKAREILGLHEDPNPKLVPGLLAAAWIAGNYGLKRDKYEIAMALGADLLAQVDDAERCSTAPCGCSRSARSSPAGRRSYADSIAALWRPAR